MAHPEIPHGTIRIGFTPDEEVGAGTKFFDVARFGAVYAYTMDGETRGELETESFSADAMTITFQGFNTHPGYAKGKMINAIKVAADFIDRLPTDELSPETTDGLRGLRPPVRRARVGREDERQAADPRLQHGRAAGEGSVARAAGGRDRARLARRVVRVEDRRVLPQHEGSARRASARRSSTRAKPSAAAASTVRERPIRGGTDGCRLSFMGLPTPNIFAGEHNFHSRLEWVSVQDMEKAVEVIVNLARIWEEKA